MATWNSATHVVDSCDNNVDEVVCPYATFQLSRDQQLQLHQQRVIILSDFSSLFKNLLLLTRVKYWMPVTSLC